MQSQARITFSESTMDVHLLPKLDEETIVSFNEYLLHDEGDLTYDPESSCVPSGTINLLCHNTKSSLEALRTGPKTPLHQECSQGSSDDDGSSSSLLSQCSYLEDVPLSQLLSDDRNVLFEEVPTQPTQVTCERQTHGNAQDSTCSNHRNTASAEQPRPLALSMPRVISDVMADEVVNLDNEQPLRINDVFAEAISGRHSMDWDESDEDQQIPHEGESDEESFSTRRRVLNSCGRDAVVPAYYQIEE